MHFIFSRENPMIKKLVGLKNRVDSNDAQKKQEHQEECTKNYHTLFEQATDAIMVTDFKGNFIDVNTSLCNLFGYSKEELLKSNVKLLLDQEHLKSFPLQFDLLKKGENVFNERKMVRKDGSFVYVEANAKKFMDGRIMAIVRDITDRKNMDLNLQQTEANLHTIFTYTDTIYVLLDQQLRIISYNPRAIDFAANELRHVIKTSDYFIDYFSKERQKELQYQMSKVLQGDKVNYDVSYKQQDGSLHWYNVRMLPIIIGDKIVHGMMLAVSNITQNKLLEEELITRKVEEQRKITKAVLHAQEVERNRMGQELHDNVNQILSSIKLYLAMIEDDPAAHKDMIAKTKEFTDQVINEIRSICKEQVTPQKKFDLLELLQEITSDLNDTQEDILFTCHVVGPITIDDDLKLNIYRIVQEQVNNIIKYSQASEARIHIEESKGLIELAIIDNGKGFDPIVGRKGIGLSNIMNRVESYNGHFIINSKPGEGCKILITLPV